jgi:hypothetical protein
MLPEDVFRARLDRTIAGLRQWRESHTDCARAEEQQTSDFWRLRIQPLAAGTCPVEMVLHQRQTCDLAIDGEYYEDRSADEIERLLPIVTAISTGQALKRLQKSANTGACLAIETVIRLPNGEVWKADRWLRPDIVAPRRLIREDRWFLPYRRS